MVQAANCVDTRHVTRVAESTAGAQAESRAPCFASSSVAHNCCNPLLCQSGLTCQLDMQAAAAAAVQPVYVVAAAAAAENLRPWPTVAQCALCVSFLQSCFGLSSRTCYPAVCFG